MEKDYDNMSRGELLKEVKKLDKQLYRKKVDRLSWKKIMRGSLTNGPNYWSNGHFALLNNIVPMPEAINKLKDIYPRSTDTQLSVLIGDADRKPTDKKAWYEVDEDNMKKVVTEHGIKFQKLYIDALEKLVPGFNLKIADGIPAIIEKDGGTVGLIMPLKNK